MDCCLHVAMRSCSSTRFSLFTEHEVVYCFPRWWCCHGFVVKYFPACPFPSSRCCLGTTRRDVLCGSVCPSIRCLPGFLCVFEATHDPKRRHMAAGALKRQVIWRWALNTGGRSAGEESPLTVLAVVGVVSAETLGDSSTQSQTSLIFPSLHPTQIL